MKVRGKDCALTVRTSKGEMDIPYSDETLREAVTLLKEETAIEGDGVCRAIRKINGVTGCIITHLTIVTAPLLLCLAMGIADKPVYVSGTRNLHRLNIRIFPMEDAEHFDLIQDRQIKNVKFGFCTERKLYEGCKVNSFELRVLRDEAVKLKLEISGEYPPVIYPYTDTFKRESGEVFSGDYVTYTINGQERKNVFGITLASKKEGGTKTELWIKRALEQGPDLLHSIDEFVITARLLRDNYENRHLGTFRINLKKLMLSSDETNINSVDTVIGPLRYYISGNVSTEVFINEQ